VAADLVKSGQADGVVSAGNTAATMAISKLRWRMLPGISRPAIAAIIPSQTHPCILLDVGANVDCKPVHLLHFGAMGAVYARDILGRKNPEIGLLSIGEEEIKGNAQTAAAFDLFEESKLNFIGNVEGRDILNGRCDVIVCDGFVGNIVLKFGEALAEHILTHLKGRMKASIISSLAALAMRSTLRQFKAAMDPDEFGGAPLLGVNGACIICHGASNEKAIMNAIRVAGEFANNHVNDHIVADVAALGAKVEE
jgi:glycerol-3-phosphate acyltransferase PlsX